jgi:hypothetical protein
MNPTNNPISLLISKVDNKICILLPYQKCSSLLPIKPVELISKLPSYIDSDNVCSRRIYLALKESVSATTTMNPTNEIKT